MKKLSIVVVLYNCELTDSQTLRGLLSSTQPYSDTQLVIWNNGPTALKDRDISSFECLGLNVAIEETIENRSLARIYNAFIHQYSASHYVILDDDSSVDDIYIEPLRDLGDIQIAYPIVTSGEYPCSPKINKNKPLPSTQPKDVALSSHDHVEAIGSGMVISDALAKRVEQEFGDIFDERFYIYGVDTTFCWRVNRLLTADKITIIPGFNHSISRKAKESSVVKTFRRIEKANSKALKIVHYKSAPARWLKTLQILFMLCIPFYRKRINREYIRALLTGKHTKLSDSTSKK